MGYAFCVMDVYSAAKRSEVMSRVRSKDTGPELLVRRTAHALGFRYVLHSKKLPGHPDLVFPSRRKVIFVHGCFWHQHQGCPHAAPPRSRQEYWLPKLQANRERDSNNLVRLKDLGWKVLLLWECELRDSKALKRRLNSFLKSGSKS
jgi:DNA mismatch endonuclease, patch repair protein